MRERRELIDAYDEAWNRQDLDALCAFHADDVVFENHTAGERAEGADGGAGAHRRHLRALAVAALPRPALLRRRRLRGQRVDGDRRRGRTASTIEWDGVDVFPLRDGKIARKDVYSTSHAAARSRLAGRRSAPRAPRRGRRVASTVPPAASTTCLTIASPRPVPREARARRRARSARRGAAGRPRSTPIPSSAAVRTVASGSRVDRERERRAVAGVADRVLGQVLGDDPEHPRAERHGRDRRRRPP